MTECSRGCGLPATYITKKGVHLCHKNAGKCPACSSKGKPKTNRFKPILIVGDMLCDYGCNNAAKYTLKNGKHCCSTQAGNCSAIREVASKKISIARNKEIAPGITLAQSASRKAAETKYNDVDKSGKNKHQRSAEYVSKIKREKINPVTGLNVHQENGKRYKEWLETDSGKARLAEISLQVSANQNAIDPETGEKEASRRARKMVETKLADIDQLGLNGFERSHWKGGSNSNTGFIKGVYWQYSNERRFLERADAMGIIENIKRGPAIPYEFNGNKKTYLIDYQLANKVFEVKSKYTMFGQNNEYLPQNVAKLLAAKQSGYEVFVVIDDETLTLESFLSSISDILEGVINNQLPVFKNSD